jgi:hypothetical protein
MSGSFQPLSGRLGPAREGANSSFRLKVVPQAAAPAPAAAAGQPPQPAPACAHEPSITVDREGERIKTIRIQCTCGKVIELGCVY